MKQKEEWRQFNNSRYFVSSLGNVKSISSKKERLLKIK